MNKIKLVLGFLLLTAAKICTEIAINDFGLYSDIAEGIDGKFVLPKQDSVVSSFLRTAGQFEKPFISLVKDIVTSFPHSNEDSTIVLDIGANLGAWSVPLSTLPNCTIYAFEPQRHIMAHLRATLLLNGIFNVIPVYGAVANESSRIPITDVPLFISHELNFGALSILGPLNPANAPTIKTYSNAPLIMLDGFYVNEMQGECPKFLKLDIEHYELFAFLGARTMLRRCTPLIFFENNCEELNRSVFLLLVSLGYELYYVMLPFLDYSYQYKLERNFEVMFNLSESELNNAYFGSLNVLAIPRGLHSRVHEIYPEQLRYINVTAGQFKVDDLDINYCLHSKSSTNQPITRCGKFFLHRSEREKVFEDEQGVHGACGENFTLPSFMVHYWKHFSYLLDKSVLAKGNSALL